MKSLETTIGINGFTMFFGLKTIGTNGSDPSSWSRAQVDAFDNFATGGKSILCKIIARPEWISDGDTEFSWDEEPLKILWLHFFQRLVTLGCYTCHILAANLVPDLDRSPRKSVCQSSDLSKATWDLGLPSLLSQSLNIVHVFHNIVYTRQLCYWNSCQFSQLIKFTPLALGKLVGI